MNILLLSMPDSFEHTPSITIRMPNGALASLAGNLDPHHHVAIADLVLAQSSVRRTVERLISEQQPDVVGLSVMTFQRSTARRIIALVRSLKPDVRVVVGGYDPSLAPDAWTHPDLGVDLIVRGEGDVTFREAIRALEEGRPLDGIAGVWFRDGDEFRRNPSRTIASLGQGTIRLPNRAARVLSGSGYASEDTRRLVLEVARELGYVPNQIARSLRTRRTKMVGLLIGDVENLFYSVIARNVESATRDAGYHLVLCNSDDDPETEREYLRLLEGIQVDALIVTPTSENRRALERLLDKEMVIVQMDRQVNDLAADAILVDNEA